MDFTSLLSRCDTEIFQNILGRECVRLMGLMDASMSSPTFVRTVLTDALGEAALLVEKKHRDLLFDLLRPEEAQNLCDVIGIKPLPDPFTAIKGTNFPRNSIKELALFRFFERVPPQQEQNEGVPDVIEIESAYPLFPHQRKAARDITSLLLIPPYRALLHMPTGSGKTRTAMSLVSDFLRNTEPRLVIWVAYSEELCEQAASEFTKTWKALGDRSVKLRRFWGDHELDTSNLDDGLIIVGLPKLIKRAVDIAFISKLSEKCSLLIIDEAHQAIAPHYKIVLNALLVQSTNTAMLGLTATPGRTWNDITADEELAEFFARRKVTLKIPGFDSPVDYLVSEGYLARTIFSPLFHQGGTRITEADRTKVRAALDLPSSILESIADDELRNLAIIARIEQLVIRHKRLILFASSVRHAHLLAAVLLAKGHKASAVTTLTPPLERANILVKFKSDDLDTRIVCNFGVLTTGFDAPKTSCAVIARPTKSLVLYSQMVGRAIRGPKAGGNVEAEIVTVVDNQLPGFGQVSEAFSNWEDIWE